MIDTADTRLAGRWFPVARSDDAAPGHIFHGRLLGQELAVWRDEAGRVNVWENRCPHRGTRLTIGMHLGAELGCRYHGWRFAAGSGQCTAIPANPGLTPPKGACTKVFSSRESAGLIWVNLEAAEGEPLPEPLSRREGLPLRGIVVQAPASRVVQALRGYRFVPSSRLSVADDEVTTEVQSVDSFTLLCTATVGTHRESLLFVVQPNDASKATVHGMLQANLSGTDRMATLRHHNTALSALRDGIEGEGRP